MVNQLVNEATSQKPLTGRELLSHVTGLLLDTRHQPHNNHMFPLDLRVGFRVLGLESLKLVLQIRFMTRLRLRTYGMG